MMAQTNQPVLSKEGQARKAAHDFLMVEFTSNRKVEFLDNKRILNEVVISSSRQTFKGKLDLELPRGSERVASMFRYLILKGKNLDKIQGGLKLLPYAPDGHMHHSKHEAEFYRVQMASMPVPSKDMPQIRIQGKIVGNETVIVEAVLFNSQGKLSTTFDDIPYRNLGAEYPREKVIVNVDTDCELSIDGHVDLDRDKWFRYYATPGGSHETLERWAAERNFKPGRQIFKFQPALVDGYSPNQPKLKEIPGRPGVPELRFFDKYRTMNAGTVFKGIDYAMCFDSWPKFMSRQPNGRGTPLVERFDDAADLAAAYVAAQKKQTGQTATWWEVKNESTIKAEWDYHWIEDYDSWKLMADLHNKVAKKVKSKSPETKVGGPASAWMQVQVKDFSLYKNQQRFMDLTKDDLDFYSHHFYEDIGSLGAHERADSKYTNYLLGRLEAILNMFSAHMHGTDNVKPILVTECGSLQAGRGPSDYWLRLRSFNAYLTKFMQRPHQVDLVVPFVFLNVPWNPTSGNAAFIPKEGQPSNGPIQGYDKTPVANFFELWRDFDGRRLDVKFDRAFLDVVAVHNDTSIQVAITNMGGRRASIDLSSIEGQAEVVEIWQKRMFYENGQVKYLHSQIEDSQQIPVDVEETTVINFSIKARRIPSNMKNRLFAYAPATSRTFDNATEQVRFVVDLPKHGLTRVHNAVLIVGIHNDKGLTEPIVGNVNQNRFSSRFDWARGIRNLFAPVRIKIDPASLKQSNIITISKIPGLTITSVHLEVDSKSNSQH